MFLEAFSQAADLLVTVLLHACLCSSYYFVLCSAFMSLACIVLHRAWKCIRSLISVVSSVQTSHDATACTAKNGLIALILDSSFCVGALSFVLAPD